MKIADTSFNDLNPSQLFKENSKAYRILTNPESISEVTTVRFYSSVKFFNNIFDDFSNIYYVFLLSGEAIESRRSVIGHFSPVFP